MNKNSKGFVLILLLTLITIVGIVVAGYFIYKNGQIKVRPSDTPLNSPTSKVEPASHWKTYTNSDLGFSFKYPDNWFLLEEKNNGVFISNKPVAKVSDNIVPSSEQMLVKFYFFQSAFENGLGITELVSDSDVALVNETKYIANDNSFGTIFTYRKNDPMTKQLLSTANQILFTFKFLDSDTKQKECLEKTICKGSMPCMANPSSVFCTCMGGVSEIKEKEDGQYGICKIDGREYDSWEYFRKINPN